MDFASLTPDLRRQLLNSAARLVRLLELGAPDVIVANELGILFRKGLAGLGSTLLEATHRQAFYIARTVQELCAQCNDPLVPASLADSIEPLCATHLAEKRAIEARYDTTGAEADDGP